MTIIYHGDYRGVSLDVSLDCIGDSLGSCSARNKSISQYLKGKETPNYSMPAIPTSIGIGPEFVDVATYDYFYGSRLASRQCWRKVKEWCL